MYPAAGWRFSNDPLASPVTRLIAAEAASNFGSMLSRLAIPWLATLVLDATPWQMAALLLADVVAGALGMVLLGALVERRGRRAVMLAADLARAGLLGLLALAAWGQALTMAMLCAAAAAGALLTGAFEIARSAWMAQRLEPDRLAGRNAQLAAASSLSETAAFALGGWIYQGFGAIVALAANATSYLASALCLRGIGEVAPAPAPAPRRGPAWEALVAELRDGIARIAGEPVLRALARIEALRAAAMGVAGTSWMIFVARDIGVSPGLIGMVAALGGLGALAGAALAPRLGREAGPARAMALGLGLAAVGTACVAAMPGPGVVGIALMAAQQLIGDAGIALHEVHDRTLRQTRAGEAWLARVDAALRSVGQAATLAGAALGAAAASTLGARSALVLSALLLAGAALAVRARLRPVIA